LIEELGAEYRTDGISRSFDLIFECTGYAPVVFGAMKAVGKNGVLVLSSVTGGSHRVEVDADKLNLDFHDAKGAIKVFCEVAPL